MTPPPDPSVEAGDSSADARCPYCGSSDTDLEHPKGPSLCRSIYFCNVCAEPFETIE
ncbi:PaaD-like zinc ribbon domain-containing protein [Halocatena halophila]|uniref:PaaD-like zinc ribbon domain-containing protein n=1 Tax=Halocatena halophila TaxID=2814576 RepID=UPI002ED33F53